MKELVSALHELHELIHVGIINEPNGCWHIGATPVRAIVNPAVFLERFAAVLYKRGFEIHKTESGGLTHFVRKGTHGQIYSSSTLHVSKGGTPFYIGVYHKNDPEVIMNQIRIQSPEYVNRVSRDQKSRLIYWFLSVMPRLEKDKKNPREVTFMIGHERRRVTPVFERRSD